MSIKEWRQGKWSGQDWKRFWMHFPVGTACAWAILSPLKDDWRITVAGVVFTFIFIVYEAFEDWRIGDLSFKDILGLAWGFGGFLIPYSIF